MALAEVFVPIFLLIGLGYAFGRGTALDHEPVAKLSLNLLAPALIMDAILKVSIDTTQLWEIAVFTLGYALIMTLLCLAWYRLFRLSPEEYSALKVATVFTNCGFYGYPVVLFAYGNQGFALALVFGTLHTVLMYTLGVYFVAAAKTNWLANIKNVLLNPQVLAVLAALALRLLGVSLPAPLAKTLAMLAQAALPLFLVILGLQLTGVSFSGLSSKVALGTVTRMALGPLAAAALLSVLGIGGLTFKVMVVEAAMPSAVIMTLLAAEYDTRPDLVSCITLATTLVSVVTVPLVIYFLS